MGIVPEWYFLCQFAMLKAVPNKNAGFIILLTSIFILFFCGEIRNLTTFTRLMDCNNGFSLSLFFLSLHSFLWIGSQFPFLLCGFGVLHLFYLHFHSSNNPLRLNSNNKIPFFSFIFLSFFFIFSLDRCSIPSREVSILCSYLDIILLFSSYVYLISKKKK